MSSGKDNKKNDSKKSKSSKSSPSSSSSQPSTVLEESSSGTSSTTAKKSRTSKADASKNTKSKKSGGSGKQSSASKVTSNKSASQVTSFSSATQSKQSKVNARQGRDRKNPLTTEVPNNKNLPKEATAEDITQRETTLAFLDRSSLYNDEVKEEFSARNIQALAGTYTDPERFLKPASSPNESFLDRHVDPVKLIKFMVDHMNKYYDLSQDKETFSEERKQMDNVMWDILGLLIPLLCQQTISQLNEEPLIVNIKPDVVVFGDLHGNFNDVHYIYNHFIVNPNYENYGFVFLGDYVDRGPKSIEIVVFLFALKLAYPHRFVLLRGNHEVFKVNRKYGFKTLCTHIFQDNFVKNPVTADLVYKSFNSAFTFLSVAAVVRGRSKYGAFLCHGGIPNSSLKPHHRKTAWTIGKLNSLATKPVELTPSKRASPQERALNEILWNDPLPRRLRKKREYKRVLFKNNKKRGGHCSYFTAKGLRNFLKANNLKVVIRGHQYRCCKHHGFKKAFSGKLLTIFSSSNYCGSQRNATGYALVTGSNCTVRGRTLRTVEQTEEYALFNIFKIVVDEATNQVTQVLY